MTKVNQEIWNERMNNLNERRAREVIKNSIKGVDDYKRHIEKAFIGKTVLDVGCGSRIIMRCLPNGTKYLGIDPFPQEPEDAGLVKMEIEKCTLSDNSFETVYAFAMLDNVYDLEAALSNIKRVASKNVLFLTGVNIEPDQYHTIKITEEDLVKRMEPFTVSFKEYLHPKILLIEFKK